MFDVFEYINQHHHEQLVFCYDAGSGLKALIAVHNTTLGPGLGGVRLWQYPSHEAAVLDALRLAEGMTYKAAVAGLQLGGGKSVILADGQEHDPAVRARRFRAFGKFVNNLAGTYVAAEDVGTKISDMDYIHEHTDHVVGLAREAGGSGDPSPMTAFGVMRGIRAMVEAALHTEDLTGIRVALQGLGKVGLPLAEYLVDAGAIVVGTDVNQQSIKLAKEKLGIEIVEPDAIYDIDCDIFAPSALGAVINDDTLPRLKCKIVAGPANNQLAEPHHAEALRELGIAYAVDYVINAGGLINVSYELGGYDEGKAQNKTAKIYDTIKHMLEIAEAHGITTEQAAQRMAHERLSKGKTPSNRVMEAAAD